MWQFKVLPRGLSTAPATFERLMEQVLAGLPLEMVAVFLHDVIVHGNTFGIVVSYLRLTFTRFRLYNLKLSPKKCNLFQPEIEFLGHVVSAAGISTQASKIETIVNWPTPHTLKQLQSFLGTASYYRKFVKKFSALAQALTQLTKKREKFVWGPTQETAFSNLKSALTTAPVLAYSSQDDLIVLDCDASALLCGAVLQQIQNGVERVIAYFIYSFDNSEQNYCVTRKELLAIIKALKQFHHYLYERRFQIRSDHAALK